MMLGSEPSAFGLLFSFPYQASRVLRGQEILVNYMSFLTLIGLLWPSNSSEILREEDRILGAAVTSPGPWVGSSFPSPGHRAWAAQRAIAKSVTKGQKGWGRSWD